MLKSKFIFIIILTNWVTLFSQISNLDLVKFIESKATDWNSKEFQELNGEEKEFVLQSLEFGCRIDGNDIRLIDNFKKIDSKGIETASQTIVSQYSI